MAYYYKINDSTDVLPPYKGFHLQKAKKKNIHSEPNTRSDFSKHVLIELLDDVTPESKLWSEMGLNDNKNIIHKRMMIDSHRIKCRRAIVICIGPDEAKQLAQRLSQTKIMNRCVCAIVIQDLLSDLRLFEKQIAQFGDHRSQHQLVYVTDLSRSRGPSGLMQFLKEKFSPFGTILSILVCSDSDDYAFPEGVIKFSYLSEAFAAELALDQFVVGKERLSVTTHHNILLSQCDLRLRLRDARWYCNAENDESSKSLFNSYRHSYNLGTTDDNSVENSFSSLHISFADNSQNADDNSSNVVLEDGLPAFSQCNFNKNSTTNEAIFYVKEKNCNGEQNPCIALPVHKASDIKNNNSNIVIDSSVQKRKMLSREAVSFELSATKVIESKDKSQSWKPHTRKNLLSSSCSFKNKSDSGSFMTCKSFGPDSNTLFHSPKKSTCDSFNSRGANSILEYQSLPSNHKQLSSQLEANLNDSKVPEESVSKHSKKRKKKYTPSQKLSLKSQRTGSTQNECCASANTQMSPSKLSADEQSQTCQKFVHARKTDLDFATNQESSRSSRVANWLLHLPATSAEDEELSSSLLTEKNELWKSKILIHRTPALKRNAESDNENEDPNNVTFISSCQTNSIILTDAYKSPLQMWLKEELISSTNNIVFESKETSKNIIICAMKSKDVIISVGCSHMTCESCYPESTELLLGYG